MKRLFSLVILTLIALPLSYSQIVNIQTPPTGSIRIQNSDFSSLAGSIVQNIGDFNGDGLTDFALSFPLNDAVYVVYGKRNFAPILNLASLGPNGFLIQGNSGTGFGAAIVSPGDVDRDGKNELMIGAPLDGTGGRIYVVKGSYNFQALSASDSTDFMLVIDGAPGENLGQVLGKGGSVDGDSSADLLIPSPYYVNIDENDQITSGAAYIIYGQISFATQTISTESLDPTSTLTLFNKPQGDNNNFSFGSQLEAIGDFLGNGSNDIAFVGNIDSENPQVQIYILPGDQPLTGVYTLDQIPITPLTITLSLFSTSEMHQIDVLTSNDLTQDGLPDLICGFSGATLSDEVSSSGVVAIVKNPQLQSGTLAIHAQDISSTALITLYQNNAGLGSSIACSSKYLFVGAPFATVSVNEMKNQGALLTVPLDQIQYNVIQNMGEIASPIYYGRESNDLFGSSIAYLGDLNKDGYEEVLVSTSEIGENNSVAYIVNLNPTLTGISDFMLY